MPPFRHSKNVTQRTTEPSHVAGKIDSIRQKQQANQSPAASTSVTRNPPKGKSPKGSTDSEAGSRAGTSAQQNVEELVGPVTETTESHQRRHCPFNDSCTRCHWIQEGSKWVRKHGRVPAGHRTPLTGEFWLQPRQPRRGGQWALGCSICALVSESCNRAVESAKHKRKLRGFDTKWARYEIRSITQVGHIDQHARKDMHVQALRILNHCDLSLGTGSPHSQLVSGSSRGPPVY